MGRIAAVLLTLSLATSAAHAADDEARLKVARAVVEAAHAGDNMRVVLPIMTQHLRTLLRQKGAADASEVEVYITRFQKKFEAEIPQFIDLVAKVYAKEFSDTDLSALLTFYQTPAGQHLLTKQPEVAKAMLTLGQQWGQTVAQEVLAEMDKEKATAPSPKL